MGTNLMVRGKMDDNQALAFIDMLRQGQLMRENGKMEKCMAVGTMPLLTNKSISRCGRRGIGHFDGALLINKHRSDPE